MVLSYLISSEWRLIKTMYYGIKILCGDELIWMSTDSIDRGDNPVVEEILLPILTCNGEGWEWSLS
jgi:hypothetical protein